MLIFPRRQGCRSRGVCNPEARGLGSCKEQRRTSTNMHWLWALTNIAYAPMPQLHFISFRICTHKEMSRVFPVEAF